MVRESTETTKAPETSLANGVTDLALYHVWRAVDRARRYLGGRRGLIILAVAVLVAGGALNWSWLVAIGVAPLLVALAPCAAMCALGLCMMRKVGGGICASEGKASSITASRTGGDPRAETSRTHPLRTSTAKDTRGGSTKRTREHQGGTVTGACRPDCAANPAATITDDAAETTGERT